MTNRSQVQVNPTLNQNESTDVLSNMVRMFDNFWLVQYNFVDQSNGTVDIPCEYCGKAINFDDYNNHTVDFSTLRHIFIIFFIAKL